MKTFVTCLFSLVFISSLSAADLKIAIVDMKRAFGEYAKGKEAAAVVKANADKFMEERKEQYEKYKDMGNDAGKLQKKAQDPILSQGERAKAGAEFEAQVKKLRTLEGEIKEFEQRRTGQLREEESQVRTKILEEMSAVVEKLGKAGAYNMVLDKSGASMGGIPMALYVDGLTDITEDLIKELNKDAPAPKSEEVKKAAAKK
jgi:outer membrane protein